MGGFSGRELNDSGKKEKERGKKGGERERGGGKERERRWVGQAITTVSYIWQKSTAARMVVAENECILTLRKIKQH